MGAELMLCQTSAWIVTKSRRRRTCLKGRQISLGLQEQELLKLKTYSRVAAPETEEITKGTETKHTLQPSKGSNPSSPESLLI